MYDEHPSTAETLARWTPGPTVDDGSGERSSVPAEDSAATYDQRMAPVAGKGETTTELTMRSDGAAVPGRTDFGPSGHRTWHPLMVCLLTLFVAASSAACTTTTCQLPRVNSHLSVTVDDVSKIVGATSAKACVVGDSCDVVDYAANQTSIEFAIGNATADVPSSVTASVEFLDQAGNPLWSKRFDDLTVTVSETGGNCTQSFWSAHVDLG